MSRIVRTACVAVTIAWTACVVTAACCGDELQVETVLSGLRRPGGVAIRPSVGAQLYEIYVAESGAQRVVKVRSDRPNEPNVVIKDFPVPAGEAAGEVGGNPRALLFLTPELLAVGSSGILPDVRLFELDGDGSELLAEKPKQRIALPAPEGVTELPSGAFIAFARTRPNDKVPDLLLATAIGDLSTNGVWKLPIRAGTLSDPKRLEAKPDDKTGTLATCVAVSEQGFVVVAQTTVEPRATALVFKTPTTGAAVMRVPIELRNVVGLAYATKSPSLYAIDAGTSSPDEAGVYRIDDASQPGQPACKIVRIHKIAHPTALAFGPDGALYVTAWGNAEDRNDQGVLVRIKGDL